MDKVLNLQILSNPANWLVIFIVFTIWAFAAHYVAQHLNNQQSA